MFSEVDSANLEESEKKPSKKHKVSGKGKKAKKHGKKKHHAKKIATKKG
jgi:hypothetical protein